MNATPELIGTNITLVGGFRPANFSAYWLLDRGLVRKSDVDSENADEDKIRNEFYQLRGAAFSLAVTLDRLTVEGPASSAPVVKDLVIGLLQLNAASAVTALGLNFNAHYKCDNEQEWHSVGHALAPKAVWNELFPDKLAGMQTLQIRLNTVGKVDEWIDLTMQPSAKLKHGVFFSWNDHHNVSDENDPEAGIATAIDIVTSNYDRLCTETYKKFSEVLTHATK